MNYFKAYSTALHSKWYKSMVKWIIKPGAKRVLFSLTLLIAAIVISFYDFIFCFQLNVNNKPNMVWVDYVKLTAKVIAICVFTLNGLAWALSGFKYNVIFLTQMTLLTIYLVVVYANVIFDFTFIPYALVILSIVILIRPKQERKRSHRRSSSRSHSSRSRKRKTTAPADSPEADITES